MYVKQNRDNSVTVTLTESEIAELTFEIAMTDSVWCQSNYFLSRYSDPQKLPLARLRCAILSAKKGMSVRD